MKFSKILSGQSIAAKSLSFGNRKGASLFVFWTQIRGSEIQKGSVFFPENLGVVADLKGLVFLTQFR